MKRLVFTIESQKGFLQDIEKYTDSLVDAVSFSTLDTAIKRLSVVRKKLTMECWIGVNYLEFPRSKPAPSLTQVHPTY